jgi:AraC-like DNA-binding protein
MAAARADTITRTPQPGALARLRPALERLHARPEAPLSLADAATACSMSAGYFSRCFKAATGQSFSDYAADYRLLLGAHRVLAADEPISRIAFAAGFANPSHFTARFTARFGMSPRAYRRARDARAALAKRR